jgi:hypothetical protein
MAPVNEEGGNARPHQRLGRGLLCAAVLLCPLLAHVDFGTRDGTVLAAVYAQQVDRRRDIPESEQRAYAELLAENLAAEDLHEAQYVVIVDRNPFVQAAMIYWMSTDGEFHFIGASPVSTGKPGRFEHFLTPTGVFEHTIDSLDFFAEGTRNEFGIRGYGRAGMRVYDFGWRTAEKGWDCYMLFLDNSFRVRLHSRRCFTTPLDPPLPKTGRRMIRKRFANLVKAGLLAA